MTNPGFQGGTPVTSDEKMMAGLAYVGDFILCIPSVLIFLLKKDESEFIKFHALQAIGLFVAGLVIGLLFGAVGIIVGIVPVLGWIAGGILLLVQSLLGLALAVYLLFVMIKAFMGETIEVPVLSTFIRNNLMK